MPLFITLSCAQLRAWAETQGPTLYPFGEILEAHEIDGDLLAELDFTDLVEVLMAMPDAAETFRMAGTSLRVRAKQLLRAVDAAVALGDDFDAEPEELEHERSDDSAAGAYDSEEEGDDEDERALRRAAQLLASAWTYAPTLWLLVVSIGAASLDTSHRHHMIDTAADRTNTLGVMALAMLLFILAPVLTCVLLIPMQLLAIVVGACLPLAHPHQAAPLYFWLAGVILALWLSTSLAAFTFFHLAHDSGVTKMSCRVDVLHAAVWVVRRKQQREARSMLARLRACLCGASALSAARLQSCRAVLLTRLVRGILPSCAFCGVTGAWSVIADTDENMVNVCGFGCANMVGSMPGVAIWTIVGAALNSVDSHERIGPIRLLATWTAAVLFTVGGGALVWCVAQRLKVLRSGGEAGERPEVGEVQWALIEGGQQKGQRRREAKRTRRSED